MNYDGEIIIGTKLDTDGLENDLESLKKDFQGGKASKKIGENDIGEPLIEGIKFGINKNAYQAEEAMKNALEGLNLQKKMGIVTEEEYYTQLEELRDKYFAKGSLGWWNYTAQIISYETKVYNEQLKKIDDIFDKIDDAANEFDKSVEKSFSQYENKMENLEKREDKFSSRLASSDILNKVTFSIGGDSEAKLIDGKWQKQDANVVVNQLKDLKEEITLLERYESLLNEFSQKENLPKGMFENLKSYGLEQGIDYMSSVLNLTKPQYDEYIADYNKRDSLSDTIAKTVYNDEANTIKEEFLTELSKAFEEIDKDFLQCGLDAANAFGESFSSKMAQILENVKESVKMQIKSIESSFTFSGASKGSDTRIYNLYGSGETTAQKLQAARADAELEKLRGGY